MEAAFLFVAGLLILLMLGLHVASALILLAFGADQLLSNGMMVASIGSIAWDKMNDFTLVAIPLFVMLGEILIRGGVADQLYSALSVWMNRLPGGLLHTNIYASTVFAATSGSSVATAATIGTIAIPELEARGYNRRLIYGSLASGGTLGVLIPPSILMIVYGTLADLSVSRLFIAAIVPGLLLAGMMSLTIILISIFIAPPKVRSEAVPLAQKLRMLLKVLPILVVFFIVMGSIYGGLATPTEAAALGIVSAIVLAGLNRKLSVRMMHEAFLSAFRTTSMIMLIIVSAFCLNFIISILGLPQDASRAISEAGLSPYALIWLLVLFYVVLGCFLEAVAMMVTTVGIVVPIVIAAGFDPLWFGVFLTILMEISLITPPVGLNLYVIQNLRPKESNINDVFIGIAPFVGAFIAFVAIIIYLPEIVLWLPRSMD
ncbi:TRAP transporter large permease [Allosediminivita pacifica]|uniref:TRAP transporter large permease protein n=1 Tax=Allosediminivita pacifica TaxID=1267769 RepID=A0A2T6AR01_9RHOB|nr:TRAP transporter large permease subunit [Allosediminivita pacifica]PTX46251.1 tripartite ATP-independent transporter DctM subunit [Allosediminivita pacifica]GGB17619.1 membrane protein [Allosediminivita pacifica]